MRFLSEQIKKDLKLQEGAVQELYGGMSDIEQQRIVEDFGRTESKIRILVASDVASEGINLHYLSHRLIHFDIPWSLMVFQQRNGRIDRYGQKEQPDIRYFLIKSNNEKIRGDMRIMEILIEKEAQAYKNIGDPTSLMGAFDVEEEEKITASAIEGNKSAEEFSERIDKSANDFDPFELLMQSASKDEYPPKIVEEDTLYTDIEYIKEALVYQSQEERQYIQDLQTVEGIEVKLNESLKRRLEALMPKEAMPQDDYLRLSPNKEFCMEEMRLSMQSNLEDGSWPKVQYLWKLHPIFTWLNDRGGLIFERGHAPLLGLKDILKENELIFLIAGTIPNRKSTPIVDELFGLKYVDGKFSQELDMEEILQITRLRSQVSNTVNISLENQKQAQSLLPTVIEKAREKLGEYVEDYKERMDPLIDIELDKLSELEGKHKAYQLSIFEDDRRRDIKQKEVERTFEEFVDWVRDTLEIENNPYLRVIAVIMGVN